MDQANPAPDRDSTSESNNDSSAIGARNWHILRRRHPRAAQRLQGVDPYPGDLLHTSKTGEPILSLVGEDGVERPLHSRFRPVAEAETQIPAADDPLATYIVLGGGLGYLPRALAGELTPQNRVVWVERDLRLFRTLLDVVDVTAILDRPLTSLALGDNTDDFNWELYRDIGQILAAPVHLLAHPATMQLWPNGYAETRRAVEDFSRKAAVLMRTTLYLTRRSAINQSRNLGRYLLSPGIKRLQGVIKGRPCIVVSAGPSLQRNIEQLQRARGRVTIIAVSTALKPVLRHGVRPDFTVLLDYHELSRRYFEGIEKELAPPLVCALKANSHALQNYSGLTLFSNDPVFNTLLEGISGDYGDLDSGSTVAQLALNLANYLGADPVVLVGQDLSYPGGFLHIPGTAIQSQEFPMTNRFYSFEMRELEYYFRQRQRFLKVPSVDGGEVPTDEIFFTYLKQIEEHVAAYPAHFIDATEGGAIIAGTEIASLSEVLDRYPEEVTPDYGAILEEKDPSTKEELLGRALDLTRIRREELETLSGIYESLLELLDDIVDRNELGEAADDLVVKVLELHKEAKKYGRCYLALSHLAQSDLWLRLRADRRLDVTEESGVAKQLMQGRRDRDFVRGIDAARDYLQECLKVAEEEMVRLAEESEQSATELEAQ